MRIQQAITTLILDEPFFATLLLNLKLEEKSAAECPTMQTNGTELQYSTAFIHTLTDPELTFVLAHEVLHCALGHIWRMDDRCPEKWNIACDFVVNEQLQLHIQQTGCNTMKIPAGALLNPTLYGQSTEQIYASLPDHPQQTQPQPQNPCGKFTEPQKQDQSNSSNSSDQTDQTETQNKPLTEADWKITAVQATNTQKQHDKTKSGNKSSHLERLIKQHINPSIPWTELLRQYCDTVTRDNYTWSTPNTRYIHTGFILPTLRDQSLGDIIIAIDTSGSVPDKLLALFLSETQHLLDTAKPNSITILSCDHELQNPQTFYPGDNLTSYIPKGGGGTDFIPPFDYVTEHNIAPLLMIYFTDGQGSFPENEPHYPTLWLHHGVDREYPFGTKIELPA